MRPLERPLKSTSTTQVNGGLGKVLWIEGRYPWSGREEAKCHLGGG